MRIAVMGAGGQGGFFGGLLARAGRDVTLIDRGRHLEAILRHGLVLRPRGAAPTNVRVRATDDPSDVGACDLVLLCVKTYDLAEALEGMAPLVGRSTAVVSVQNGIGAPDEIARAFGAGRVIAGVSYVAAWVETPGVVGYGGVADRLIVGKPYGGTGARAPDVARALRSGGIRAEVSTEIRAAMWEKLVLVCSTGGVMAFLRLPWGPVLDSTAGAALARGVMTEAESVARASGVALAKGTAERVFEFAATRISRTTRSSMLLDLLAGRRLEVESLNGTIARLGREHGVPAPLNNTIYEALKPHAGGGASRSGVELDSG